MAKIQKDWVNAYFEYGIDVQNRKIFLFDDVGSESIGYIIKGMYLMEADVTIKQRDEDEIPPIELFIGSFGGSEYEMYALYDVMRTLESPIYTVALGKCMSAAPLLVACGTPGHRYATPNTFFMVHEGHDDFGDGRITHIKKTVDHYNALEKRWFELMEQHTNQTAAFWRKQCSQVGDKYFNAEQALEWGLVDHLWDEKGEDCNG